MCEGRSFYYFPIDSLKEITIPVPYTDDQIVDGTEALLIIHNDGTHEIVQPESVESGYLTVRVDKSVKSVTMMQKMGASGSAVAYLDGGMIYSSSNGSSMRMNVSLRNCTVTQAENAVMHVYYTDNSDPVNPKDTFSVFTLDTISKNGVYTLKNTKTIDFTGSFLVTKITLSVPGYPITYQNDTVNCIVNRGQQLSINIDTDIDNFNNMSEPVTTSYGLNYELESVSIDGDGRIMQERNGDSIKYRYDYYLKDHLGSTRMVFNDQQTVTEQINYQAYGTIQPLDSAAPSLPAREKFTGKEYDVQGADFARVEYDISVSGFIRRNSGNAGNVRVTYKDIATGTMYQKVYSCRVDSIGNTLRFTGSESFNSNIEIERIRLTAYGATYTISNSIPFDSLIVNTGKTRRVELNVTSGEITSAPVDSNFYTLAADEDNTAYFSGTKLFYFGSRYYDPELGIWLSVDPASQFANAYGYASNPVMMVDPDGEFFWLIPVAIGAAFGAFSGGKVGDALGAKGWEMFGYIFGGSVIGGLSGATGAGLGSAVGGVAGGIVGGGAAGSMQGFGMGLMSGQSGTDLLKAGIFGGLSGMVGGGVGAGVGHGIFGAMAGGFSGGTVGTALNGGDFGDIMLGGLKGSALAAAAYTCGWAMENYGPHRNVNNDFYELEESDVNPKYIGKIKANWQTNESNKIYEKEIVSRGITGKELGMGSREIMTLTGKTKLDYKFFEGEKGHVQITGSKWTYRIHDHTGGTAPNSFDYKNQIANWHKGIFSSYGIYSKGNFYGYQAKYPEYIYWSY